MNKELLQSLLDYDPLTGIFKWKVSKPPRGKAGEIAGYNNGSGYIKISIAGKRHYAHRLAFIFMGFDEPEIVDHINGVRHDNRFENLRSVSSQVQNLNNTNYGKGIRKRYGKWYARIGGSHIGVFDKEDEAINAYNKRKLELAELPEIQIEKVDSPNTKRWSYNKLLLNGKSISEWSRNSGIPQQTLYYRVHKMGLDIQSAIKLGI